MSALEVRIAHRFGAFSLDVDLRIPLRGVTALLGHSGAGKSSVIAAIAGILRPASGSVRFDQQLLSDSDSATWVAPEARRFGCVLQQPLLFPHLNVEENCLFGARRRRRALTTQECAAVFRLLDLQDLLTRWPRHLSGGEQQRVALARALLSGPRLLLLDEPLSAIDERKRREVLPYLERLRDNAKLPMIYVSHAVDDVARLADRVIVMQNGRVVEHGDARTVLAGSADVVARGGGSVIHGVIARHLAAENLSVIAFDGGELVVPRVDDEVGNSSRFLVRADDVMISLVPLVHISANNVLEARIDEIRDDRDGSTQVHLLCGMTPLLARLTTSSVRRLDLAVGMDVIAAFKVERLRGEP